MTQNLPKVDFHVHLEGTITPEMVRLLASRNDRPVPAGLFTADGAKYHWHDDGTGAGALKEFVAAYDLACSVMREARDYTDITYDYLIRAAAENCIYAEIAVSADHGASLSLSFAQMMAAIEEGYRKAHAETGIEARFISTLVRHYGVTRAVAAATDTRDTAHPLVTGMGLAGDENALTAADFAPAYNLCGMLKRTAHAGEAAGPASIRDSLKHLKNRRFGHMVRAIEDDGLMAELQAINAVPEVCVTSNLVLKVFRDYASHPLRKFFDAGLKVTLGSDDPTFFGTSIGREYQIAQAHFGFTDDELLQITRNALEEAFIDEPTRAELMSRI